MLMIYPEQAAASSSDVHVAADDVSTRDASSSNLYFISLLQIITEITKSKRDRGKRGAGRGKKQTKKDRDERGKQNE